MIRLKSLLKEQVMITPEAKEWLDKICNRSQSTWTADNRGVTVQGDFLCWGLGLQDFKGVTFIKVTGDFNCSRNNLTSLVGAPQIVGGTFDCMMNKLTSLKGAPRTVGVSFDCSDNNLTSLEGAPETVNRGSFVCENNPLKTLKGISKNIGARILLPAQLNGWSMDKEQVIGLLKQQNVNLKPDFDPEEDIKIQQH